MRDKPALGTQAAGRGGSRASLLFLGPESLSHEWAKRESQSRFRTLYVRCRGRVAARDGFGETLGHAQGTCHADADADRRDEEAGRVGRYLGDRIQSCRYRDYSM